MIKSTLLLFTLVIYTALGLDCAPRAVSETPEICKKGYQPDSTGSNSAKDLSPEELVMLEKCGFEYHPTMSFYGEIISSREYPIPSLTKELGQRNDDWWSEHLVYLMKSVIEHEKFHSEVIRDRAFIMESIDDSMNRTKEGGKPRKNIHNLRDGIEIYFLKQDGVAF